MRLQHPWLDVGGMARPGRERTGGQGGGATCKSPPHPTQPGTTPLLQDRALVLHRLHRVLASPCSSHLSIGAFTSLHPAQSRMRPSQGLN